MTDTNTQQQQEEEQEQSTMLVKRTTPSSPTAQASPDAVEANVEQHALLHNDSHEDDDEDNDGDGTSINNNNNMTKTRKLPCCHCGNNKSNRRRNASCCCCSCRNLICGFFLLGLFYVVTLYIWVYTLAPSHPYGYDVNDQHVTPITLALLPLKPIVQRVNRRVTPVSTHLEQQTIVLHDHDTENDPHHTSTHVKVAVMPDVWGFDEDDPSFLTADNGDNNEDKPPAFDISLGSNLSGCSPKFIITTSTTSTDHNDGENNNDNNKKKYLFKPSMNRHQVWMELLAYHINKILQFHRVPTVHPFEVPWDMAINAIHQHRQLPFLKCNLGLDVLDEWITTSTSSSDNNNNNNANQNNNIKLIGTLQVMVGGIDKQGKIVQRVRYKIGKWTDHVPNVFAQREVNTRTVLDSLIGNYDRYNNEFVQTQPNGDKLSIYIDQGSFGNIPIVTPNLFHLDSYCRFYWRPIQALRQQTDLRQAVLDALHANNLTRAWQQEDLIGVQDHPTMIYLNDRVQTVLAVVDACIAAFGHDHVFLDAE